MKYYKTYVELMSLNSYEERLKYLQTFSKVGEETFAYDRYINQFLYRYSSEWKRARNNVIIRDNACDLGMQDRPIFGSIFVHHINPLTIEDFKNHSDLLLDENNLICCSKDTHIAIHFWTKNKEITLTERHANDTCPWKK